jgi:hypothetical protein
MPNPNTVCPTLRLRDVPKDLAPIRCPECGASGLTVSHLAGCPCKPAAWVGAKPPAFGAKPGDSARWARYSSAAPIVDCTPEAIERRRQVKAEWKRQARATQAQADRDAARKPVPKVTPQVKALDGLTVCGLKFGEGENR